MKKRFLSMLLAITMVVGFMPGMTLTASAAYTSSPSLKNSIVSQETPDDVTITYEFDSSAWYPTAGTTYKLYADTNKTTEAGSVVLTDGTTPTLEVTLNEVPVRDTRYYLTATAPNSDESDFTSIVVKTYRIANGFTFSYGEYSGIEYVDFFQDQTTYDIVLPPATASNAPISVAFETANGATVTYSGDTVLTNGAGSVTAAVVSDTPALSYTYTINFTTMNLSGQGTQADPYLLTSADDLRQLADCLNNCGAAPLDAEDYGAGNFYGYCFKLTNNIDLSGIDWEPIGHSGSTYFAGHFDGDGHTVSNMTTSGRTSPGEDNTDCSRFNAAGLFGWCAFGSVKNVTVDNADVTAIGQNQMGYAGGLVAVPFECSVSNCHVKNSTIESGRVPRTNSNFAGGVAGMAAVAEFEKCSSVNNTVRGTMYVGGFIGSQEGASSYTDCYVADTTVESVMKKSSFNCNAGCFASASQDGDYIMTNCFVYNCTTRVAEGANAEKYEEGLFSKYEWSSDVAETTNCYYYTTQTYEEGTAGTAAVKTAEEFADGTVLSALNGDRTDEDAVWMQGESYPVFFITAYNITVNTAANGTIVADKETAEKDEKVTLMVTPDTGYELDTLKYNDGTSDTVIAATSGVYSFSMPAGNITITATFKPIDYTISYTLNDGTISGTNPTTYTIETESFTLTNPTKTGYTFKGWSGTDLTGDENQTVTIAKGSTGDRTYTANWTANTYTVQFNANGGSGSMDAQTFTYDVSQALSANQFTNVNKYFTDWNTASDGTGTAYQDGDNVSNLTADNNAEITLYAQWSDKSAQTITLDTSDRNATYGDGTLEARTATASGAITYSSSDESVATVDENGVITVLKAGETTITATAAETAEYASGSVSYKLIVARKTLTITADSHEVYVGSRQPELTYTVDGLVGNDTLTTAPTLTTDANMYRAGTYAIIPSGADAGDNYTITYVNGTLTVKTKPSKPTYPPTVEDTLGGDVTVTPANPKKGDDVTITPQPDAGYEVDEVIVTDQNGNPVDVKDQGDGTYTFVQPTGKVTISVTFAPAEELPGPFADVPADAYYADAVAWAVENGITKGLTETTFGPDVTCTRAQAVTFLWRAAGCPAPASNHMPFTDVASDAYYYDAVLWAVEQGITKGTSDTTFSPDDTCVRGQIVTFLWRSQGEPQANGENPFTDVAADAYYADAVLWAVEEEITTGTSAVTFSPDADCTRAQIVTFLYRTYN